MRDQIVKYSAKLLAERTVSPGFTGFAVLDDRLITDGEPTLASIAGGVAEILGSTAVLAALPSLPFADFLVARAADGEERLVPRDTETRTFLHDIPFIRRKAMPPDPVPLIAALLGKRKGIVVEGIGIIASGSFTVEQAYINYSSVFHSVFVAYLQKILFEGFTLPGEEEAFKRFRNEWLRPLSMDGLNFRPGPLKGTEEILDEMEKVGRYTVEQGLVDSFFGNISVVDGKMLHISQTGASLDSLSGSIDPVPFDNSSTTGITASSELLAHRRIYEQTNAGVILHGHPRFSVVMSMVCDAGGCPVTDCWKDCPHVRYMGGTPVVAGEIGAGGLAKRVPPVIGETGRAIVYGHGTFAIGRTGFEEAFRGMVDMENWCRGEYFRRLDSR